MPKMSALVTAFVLAAPIGMAEAREVPLDPGVGVPIAAQPQNVAPVPGQIDEGEVKEMVAVFREMCLIRFPDDAAVDASATAIRMVPMSDVEVRGNLRSAPGRGWFYRTAAAEYAVTVEQSPVRACAVRRMTPSGAASSRPFLVEASEWAVREGGKLTAMQPQRSSSPDGAEITAVPFAFLDGQGRPVQSLMVIVIDHKGEYRGRGAEAARGGTGVELRLVRQILPVTAPAR